MEKKKPHYDLQQVKNLCTAGLVRATTVAKSGAAKMGLDMDDMIQVLNSLDQQDFYKSMTSYEDHTIWHDVYRPQVQDKNVYLKLCAPGTVIIISFKEK
jgi:motility quorum-sensing regulator/GCU-specific mRNA interferase toxin